jgi:hypothetical protein
MKMIKLALFFEGIQVTGESNLYGAENAVHCLDQNGAGLGETK